MKIAVIGGTGAEGSGLALRWAGAGHAVTLGSRDPTRAQSVAGELNALLGSGQVRGDSNEAAVRDADVVVLTVPFAVQRSTVEGLAQLLTGKILVDVTVPLVPPKVSRVQLPAGGSCVVEVQRLLGDAVRVVSAFQNVGAHHLKDLHHQATCDVLVTADDKEARALVCSLADDAGLRGIDAGPLANSAAAEALTSVLIWINQKYKVPGAGIRITGLPGGSSA
ncbi:MAG: NADPH-dependent F420 reductase [Pseudomonadota bacterium]